MTVTVRIGLSAALLFLAACGERDIILPGERQTLRDGAPLTALAENQALPIALPEARTNAAWTHRNGTAEHRIDHPALGAALRLAFSTDIGAGDSRRARITADPVTDGARIYTLDARSQVSAVSPAGNVLWSRDLTPLSDRNRDASGGGLAVGDGVLIATTGFGEVTALDTTTGAELWTQNVDAPPGAAPTLHGGLVYVSARDGVAWALDLLDGRIRWTLDSVSDLPNFSGGAGVAVNDRIAVVPFSSAEVVGAFPQGGLRRWSTVIAGERLGTAAGTIDDITGDPVIVGSTAYVGNVAGRVVAVDTGNGDRLWSAEEGAVGPVWPAGGSLFFVNDLGDLVRLSAADGSVIWRVPLGGFEEGRERRQKTRIAHYGPVLAGGRLIVPGSDGLLRQFDPVSGALIGAVDIPGGASTNPAIAGGTLYLVNGRGELLAFR